jgi:hypothetical protein
MRATLPRRARSMLPWALDRPVPDAAARVALPGVVRRTFRLAVRTASASPDPNVEGRQGVSALSGSCDPLPRASPKGRRGGSPWLRHLPKEAPRPHPPRATRWMPVDLPREEAPPRRSEHPKAQGFRRHRDASPKRLVRDPVLAPKSGDRWFELVLAILPRLPAYLMVRPLAAHDPPEGRNVRAPLAGVPKDAPSNPTPRPEGRVARRAVSTTRRWALGGSWLRHLQQAGGPARARQSSCSPGRPRLDPKTKSLPRAGARVDRRRSAVGAVGPHIPPVVAIRREHRSARAEMDRNPSRAGSTGVAPASVPSAPKRLRNPDRCDPGGR